MKKKILVIRFSSIGDIIQCMSVVNPLHHQLDADVHWITRSDFTSMLGTHPHIKKIWSYDKTTGLFGLIRMVLFLRKQKFDYVYDAHQNIRSFFVRFFLGCPAINKNIKFAVRRKHHFRRFLFFKLNVRKAIEVPFKAVRSFQKPILPWGLNIDKTYDTSWVFDKEIVSKVEKLLDGVFLEENVITLVPSAAWELKRWPVAYWKRIIQLMPEYKFVIIAGPNDKFTEDIKNVAPDRVINLAGFTSVQESFYLVSRSNMVISADTGFLHAADLFNRNAIALMGPTAFGYPSGNTVKVMEVEGLSCRPCSKAGNTVCKLPHETRNCLMDITPEKVLHAMQYHFKLK